MFGHQNDNDDNQQHDEQQEQQATQDWQHPGTPLEDHTQPTVQPAPFMQEQSQPGEDSAHHASDLHSKPEPDVHTSDSLREIKQHALNQLTPLLDHLDQSPEEKFKTTMMMIQASDDHKLIKQAYEAAQNIHDEKARAQALLDIVNEINYFTQNDS